MGGALGFELSVRVDTKKLVRDLGALADKQLPFATATALNSMGQQIVDAEKANIKDILPTSKPFTINSVFMKKARKDNQTVTIDIRPIAAAYLAPYETGGTHKLNGRALLNPKDVNLDQYGNIPRKLLAKLKGQKDVFVGSITFKKSGQTVSGVWLRPPRGDQHEGMGRKRRATGKRGTVDATKAIDGTAGQRTGLTLLIRFGDALAVKQRLNYQPKARTLVALLYGSEFTKAMDAAIATANR